MLYVLLFIQFSLGAFYDPARRALIPQVVPPEQVMTHHCNPATGHTNVVTASPDYALPRSLLQDARPQDMSSFLQVKTHVNVSHALEILLWCLQLHLATTMDSWSWSIMSACGASIGGFVASRLGSSAAYLLDALSYVLAALFALAIVVSLGHV